MYTANIKIFYSKKKLKNFYSIKNISFTQPRKYISSFLSSTFINDEIQNLSENYFYNEWNNIKIENELINFILPVEDLDDIRKN